LFDFLRLDFGFSAVNKTTKSIKNGWFGPQTNHSQFYGVGCKASCFQLNPLLLRRDLPFIENRKSFLINLQCDIIKLFDESLRICRIINIQIPWKCQTWLFGNWCCVEEWTFL
jgi:hypothetical protein